MMLRSIEKLKGFEIQAADGEIGKVDELFFDERSWRVRYLVVDVGNWLFGRQVLIAPTAVSQIDAEAEKVFLALTKERIENSPEVAEDEPISREKERALHEYYQWRPYWAAGANDPLNYGVFPTALAGALGTHSLQKPAVEISDVVSVESSNLRSTAEVKGYQIYARDGVT